MKTKVLSPRTQVPEELYVERVADKQIEKLLQDFGRPGYVLVPRQMGKTNLLQRTKRKLATKEDVFVFIDLTKRPDSLRNCFRFIIDRALDTHEKILSNATKKITENRQLNSSPALEHERELRIILKSIKGKLVFFLDEIDSLTNTQYSDNIFAQIRSVYFERDNFKELEKLTYVLSGVAEPSTIIKDKTISPFNIGEKIYLDDFSYDEFKEFLKKSSLHLEEDISLHVYSWSSGHPRITWDLCSAIEDLVITGKTINMNDIDKLVSERYLDSFDIPPIDHICDLVKQKESLCSSIFTTEV